VMLHTLGRHDGPSVVAWVCAITSDRNSLLALPAARSTHACSSISDSSSPIFCARFCSSVRYRWNTTGTSLGCSFCDVEAFGGMASVWAARSDKQSNPRYEHPTDIVHSPTARCRRPRTRRFSAISSLQKPWRVQDALDFCSLHL
jgi:hypothetical protein